MDVKIYDYETGRTNIHDGDIVFIRGHKSIVGRIIQLVTNSVYTHVGIAFWAVVSGKRRLFMVENQGNSKKRIVNMSFYQGMDLDVMDAPKEWRNVSETALNRIGIDKYGYTEAAYVGFREWLSRVFGVTLPAKNFGGMICSEFVAYVYGMREQNISPAKLMQNMLTNGQHPRLKIRN